MNKFAVSTRSCVLLLMLACTAAFAAASREKNAGQAGPSVDGYQLVWADEFNKDGCPDPNNWTYEHGFARNKELQWYQPENAICENGWLIIEARRQIKPNPYYDPQSNNWKRKRKNAHYTSACLKTTGLGEWTFGRFEIRARIDARQGLWPAIWTLGSARQWPGCGEIDLMEYYDNSILANACWSDGNKKIRWDSSKKPITEFNDRQWALKVHIWTMQWDQKEIRLYVDQTLLNTIEIEKTLHPQLAISPFHEPHYILLNLAIGSTGGDPSKTTFPSRFEIDYVRVYQK